jgi:hypothetical protein
MGKLLKTIYEETYKYINQCYTNLNNKLVACHLSSGVLKSIIITNFCTSMFAMAAEVVSVVIGSYELE